MSVGVVNKQTGDRIPTTGMPAIDNALSLSSTNPVQNAIITSALANKQDKTDNSLQTTDKTVVGGINELKSGLMDLSGLKVYKQWANSLTVPQGMCTTVQFATTTGAVEMYTYNSYSNTLTGIGGVAGITATKNSDDTVTFSTAGGAGNFVAYVL